MENIFCSEKMDIKFYNREIFNEWSDDKALEPFDVGYSDMIMKFDDKEEFGMAINCLLMNHLKEDIDFKIIRK